MATPTNLSAGKKFDGALKCMDLYIHYKNLNHIRKTYNEKNPLKLCGRILTAFLNVMAEDVIDTNNTFLMPSRSISMFEMLKLTGKEYQMHRSWGCFSDHDIIETHFTGAYLQFRFKKHGRFKTRRVNVSKRLSKKILKNLMDRKY